MTVNNFYQPSPPTNWRDKLSEVYARQSQQLQEHHANLRERDQQEVARAKEESLVKTFEGLAEFSTSVANLVKAAREGKAKDKDDDDERQQRVSNFLKRIESVDLGDEVLNYSGKKKNVWKDAEFWNALKENNTHLKDVLTDIQKFDPREQILMREQLALNHVQNLKGQFAGITAGTNKYKPANWDKLNDTQRSDLEINYGVEELQKFNVPQDFAANILVGDIKRQNETTRGLARAASSNKYNQTLTQRSRVYLGITSIAENPNLFAQNIDEQIKLRTPLYKDIENGPTAKQQASAAVFQEVLSLADEGYIPSYALANIEGYLLEHPAVKGGKGNIFETYFRHDPDAKDNFIAAVNRGQSKLVETAAREDNIAFNELQQGAYNNLPPEQLDRFIQRLKSRGNLSEKQLNKLEKLNITAQSPEYEQLALDNWTPKLNTGLIGVTQEDINAIDNNAVRKKVQLSFDKLAYHNGLHGNNEGSLKSIIHAAYSSQPYTEGQKLSAWGEMISNDLDREVAGKRLQLIMAQYDDNGNLVAPNENIEGDIAALKEGLWRMRGGGTESGLYGQAQDGVGKFENYIRAKATMSRVDSRHNINYGDSATSNGVTSIAGDFWTKQFYNTLDKVEENEAGLPDRKFAIENGLLLTNDDVAGVLINGTYSDKLYTIAKLANTDPATLLIKKKEALLKSKDPNDIKFRENWGLGSKDADKELAETAVVKYLNQVYEKLDNPNSNTAHDIQFLLKKGWKWLDPVQRRRVYLYLTNEFNTDEDKDQIDKDTDISRMAENTIIVDN